MIDMRILFISLLTLLFTANHAQNKELKLVYQSSSEEAKNEIRSFLNSNPNLKPIFNCLVFFSTTKLYSHTLEVAQNKIVPKTTANKIMTFGMTVKMDLIFFSLGSI